MTTLATPPVSVTSPLISIAPLESSLRSALTVTDTRYIKGYRLVLRDSGGSVVRTIEVSDQGPSEHGFQEHRRPAGRREEEHPGPAEPRRGTGRMTPAPRCRTAPTRTRWKRGTTTTTWRARDPLSVIGGHDGAPARGERPLPRVLPHGGGHQGQPHHRAVRLGGGPLGGHHRRSSRESRCASSAGRAIRPRASPGKGKDTYGKIAPDGTYTYRLTSTDRAGNTGTASLDGIVINTQATPVGLVHGPPGVLPQRRRGQGRHPRSCRPSR